MDTQKFADLIGDLAGLELTDAQGARMVERIKQLVRTPPDPDALSELADGDRLFRNVYSGHVVRSAANGMMGRGVLADNPDWVEVLRIVKPQPDSERIAVVPVSQIEKTVRAITNDSMGRVWTSERLAPFLDIAVSRIPFLAAALACASVGNMEGADYLLQWAGPMTVKKPIRRKAKR